MPERVCKIPELLSPAADMLCLTAAVENGCDAVYVGGKNFSARRGATNFTREELCRAVEYCHLRGVRIYVAINTLYKQHELDDLYEFIEGVYTAGADAFITADFGVSTRIVKIFRDIEIHASTQMSVSTYDGATFMQTHGFSRVVLAREMPIDEVRRISNELNISTEIFVQGSLCYAYSGQCLMSGLIGGRSGNRGQCAQPCRLKYALKKGDKTLADGHLLSMRDLNTLSILPDIVDAGVTSLKIEGRQKSAQYVAASTRAYRHALDAIASGSENTHSVSDEDSLARVFSRGGKYTTGYLSLGSSPELVCKDTPKHRGPAVGRITKAEAGTYSFNATEALIPGDGIEMFTKSGESVGAAVNAYAAPGENFEFSMNASLELGAVVYKSYDKATMEALSKTFNRPLRKLTIYADVAAKLGESVGLSLSLGEHSVFGEYGMVQRADSAPVSRETILERLSKTGDTPFNIEFRHVDIDDGIFVPVSHLNNLRRMMCETFTEIFLNAGRREPASGAYAFVYGAIGENVAPEAGQAKLSVYTYEAEQLDAVLNVPGVARYYCEARPMFMKNIEAYASRAHSVGAQLFVALPSAAGSDAIRSIVAEAEVSSADGYLITNWGHFAATDESGKLRAAGSQLNATNHATWLELRDLVSTVTLSPELTIDEVATFDEASCEVVIHGRHTAYLTKMCPVKQAHSNNGGNAGCGVRAETPSFEDVYTLVDRKGLQLPILCSCEHGYSAILNGQCLSMLDRMHDISQLRVGYLRLSFTTETPDIAAAVTRTYAEAVLSKHGKAAQSVNFSSDVTQHYDESFTHGYFYRGIT